MKKKLTVLFGVILLAATVAAQTNISVPEGTALKAKLENTLSTFSNKSGDSFSARVTEAVMLDGKTVIPIGATVQGRVTKVSEPRRIAGKPTIGILPEAVVLADGQRFTLNATLVDTDQRHGTDVNPEGQFKGSGHDGKDMAEIGLGTGVGMMAGGLIAGGPGLLIGGSIAATGTFVHWLTKRKSAVLPKGTELVMELNRPMAMTAASGGE